MASQISETKVRSGKALLGPVIVLSVFVNVLMLTGPLFMLQVYDRVLGSRSQATLVSLFGLVVALYVLMGFMDFARGRLMARTAARFRAGFDREIFDICLAKSLDPKERTQSALGLRYLDAVQGFLTAPLALALFDVLWTPLFIGAIFVFNPVLGWLAVAGGGTLIAVTLANNFFTRRKVSAAQVKSQNAHGFAEHARQSSEIVRSQGMSRSIALRWQRIQNEALLESILASDWTGGFSAFTKSFRLFLQSAMLAVGAWLVLKGDLSAGAMIAASILLGRGLAPIEQSIGQWSVVQRAVEGWRELKLLKSSAPFQAETRILPVPKVDLKFNAVSAYASDTKKPLLSGVSFSVEAGQVVGVIGNSGMGKSTLAKAMVGLLPATSGEIRLGGVTLGQYDPDQLARLIGYMPQDVTLFSGTVAENIARMSIDPDTSKLFEAARRANAHEMILSLPDGYQTMLNNGASHLSGGQRQRIAFARALYDDPLILVLDEPNSALESLGTDALNKAVREFRAMDRAVIIMTHRPQAISECDRLIVLEKGRIKANGPRDEVLQAMVKNTQDIGHMLMTRAAS